MTNMYEQPPYFSLDDHVDLPQDDLSPVWYPKPQGVYDEVYDEQGAPRPHWQYLADGIMALGNKGLYDRQRKVQDLLRGDGALYNLSLKSPESINWSLDPIPLLITSEEWGEIESGMIERSELFDLILKDIYGERELIKQGILPPEILYSHPGFLRQCQDVRVPGAHQLLFHGMDMVRQPDGKFIVVGDRTQAPNGAGYALENRTVLSRVLPSLFRDSQVHRLSLYFQTMRNMLSSLATHLTPSPRVVILTPGAYSPSYFEHAHLANYLGYSLVQGGDLTVRNGQVWMKALNGLERVDVIVRRVDDVFCDQTELKADSYLGVPGLLEVAREGNVVIANPLGSGILETPAIAKYLPEISRFFLGRELVLPSVPTWWCGDKNDLAYVKANISKLIIKPVARRNGAVSVYGHSLTEKQCVDWLARIEKSPKDYVAQSYLSGSHTAAWQDKKIEARATALRTFTVSDQTSYTAMAGGLTRVSASSGNKIVTSYFGSRSKDTWILASEPEKQTSLMESEYNSHIEERHQANLPSRVVENLFWMGRYAERAETSIRLLRTVLSQLYSSDSLSFECRRILLESLSLQLSCLPGFCEADDEMLQNPDEELISIILDKNRSGSLKASLQCLLNCTEEVKEMLSADTRKIVNDLRDDMFRLDRTFSQGLPAAPEEALSNIVASLLALSGLNHESMLRGVDWHFQALGRRTERALQTANLLKSTLSYSLHEYDYQRILESVLLSVEALISFRRRYQGSNNVISGLEILMMDETNPRSMIYQFNELTKHLKKLPRSEISSSELSKEIKLNIKSLTDLQLVDLDDLAVVNEETSKRENLVDFLSQIEGQLEEFSNVISDKYFDHMTEHQQLIGLFREQ